jgi:hypothetical protein
MLVIERWKGGLSMSIEETVVLGQIPGTHYQPSHTFWFGAAAGMVVLWVCYELIHAWFVRKNVRLIPAVELRNDIVDHYSYRYAGTRVPTISPDPMGMSLSGNVAVVKHGHNTFGVQLQFFQQKALVLVGRVLRQFTQAVHKTRHTTLGATIEQRVMSVRLPSRAFLIGQARGIITGLVTDEQRFESWVMERLAQLWRQLVGLSRPHDAE